MQEASALRLTDHFSHRLGIAFRAKTIFSPLNRSIKKFFFSQHYKPVFSHTKILFFSWISSYKAVENTAKLGVCVRPSSPTHAVRLGGAQIPHIVRHRGANLPHSVSQLTQCEAKLPHTLSVGYQGIAPTLLHLCGFSMPWTHTSQAEKLHSFQKSTSQPHFHTPFSVINNASFHSGCSLPVFKYRVLLDLWSWV